MRIEISAGGLSGEFAVADYQLNMSSFISDAESIISAFKAVKSQTLDLSGGVGSLAEAVDNISDRIQDEVNKKAIVDDISERYNDFIDLAIRVDKQVASLVNQNKEELYQTSPWLRPPAPVKDEREWYEKGWDWLCGVGKAAAEGIKSAWDWTKDTAKKAWDGIVKFYKENKHLCQILIGVVAIAIAVVVTVATGGAALPSLLAMTKAALIGGLTSAAIGGSITAITSLASGKNLEETFDATVESAVDGFCSGFMWGGIFAAGAQVVSAIKTAGTGTTAINNAKTYTEKQYTNINDIPENEHKVFTQYHTDSGRFNNPIRAGKTTSDTKKLSSIISKHKLNSNKTLYRRASWDDLNGLDVSDVNSLIGKKYSFKGFMSTSPEIGITNAVSSGKVIFKFSASAGTNALDLSSVIQYREVLFDNPLCRIDNIQKLNNGLTEIFATIL